MKKEIDKWKQFNYIQKRPEHTALQKNKNKRIRSTGKRHEKFLYKILAVFCSRKAY